MFSYILYKYIYKYSYHTCTILYYHIYTILYIITYTCICYQILISHDSPCEAMLPSTLIGVDCDPAYSYLPGTGQAINIGIVYMY